MAEKGSGARLLKMGCTVILALGVLCSGCAGAIWAGVGWYFRSTDVYQEAVGVALSDPDVHLALGLPIEEGWFVVGTISDSGETGTASFAVPLQGSIQEGELFVQADKIDGAWRFNLLAVEVRDNRIDLLESIEEQQAQDATERSYDILGEGDDLARQGRQEDAIAIYTDAIEAQPDNAETWFRRGKAYYELDRLEEAEPDLDKAVEISPRHTGALSRLGSIYQRTERHEECIDAYTRVLRVDSDDADAWYQRAVCYDHAGDERKARAGAREACSRGSYEGCEMSR